MPQDPLEEAFGQLYAWVSWFGRMCDNLQKHAPKFTNEDLQRIGERGFNYVVQAHRVLEELYKFSVMMKAEGKMPPKLLEAATPLREKMESELYERRAIDELRRMWELKDEGNDKE